MNVVKFTGFLFEETRYIHNKANDIRPCTRYEVFSKTLHNLKRILKSTPLRDFIALVLEALNMCPMTIYIFIGLIPAVLAIE